MTIQTAIDEYLDWKRSYAPIAARAYKSCLGRLCEYLEDKAIESIQQIDVAHFVEEQRSRVQLRTVMWYTNILKDFFGYYLKICEVNPRNIRRPRYTPQPMEYLTWEEFKQMDAVLDEYEYYDLQKKVVIRLLWATGIRVSELCDINLSDIQNSSTMCRIITKKNLHHRWIMWSDYDHKLLMRYIGSKICLDQHNALFTSNSRNSKGRITTRSIERWVCEIAKRAGIAKRVHPHIFRHGKAHSILSKGGDYEDVRIILGHGSVVSSQIYTGLFPDEFRKVADKYL